MSSDGDLPLSAFGVLLGNGFAAGDDFLGEGIFGSQNALVARRLARASKRSRQAVGTPLEGLGRTCPRV